MFGKVELFCPSCSKIITSGDQGIYHARYWGFLCSKECYDRMNLAYAQMILGKDVTLIKA